MPDGSKDIVVAEGAIYLRSGADPARVSAIVAALQRRPGGRRDLHAAARARRAPKASVPGTLSFDVARWNHPRSGDILVSSNWNREANDAGFAGKTTDGNVAGHGSSSPYDIHNTLIAAGPDFREHAVSDVPTGNVDIAPTLLHLLGLDARADDDRPGHQRGAARRTVDRVGRRRSRAPRPSRRPMAATS